MHGARASRMFHKSYNFWMALSGAVCSVFLGSTSFAQSVTLAWDIETDPNVTGYRLHYGTSSGNYTKTVDVGNATTATIADITVGNTYYFVVTAYAGSAL